MSLKPTLLIVDYPGRRREAHIRDLVLEDLGVECRYLLASPMPKRVDAGGYARELTRHFKPAAGGILAVVSYCAAAPLGTAIAAQLGGAEPLPQVTLDPSDSLPQHIVSEYASVVGQIEDDEVRDRERPLIDVAARISQPEALAAEMSLDLAERVRRASLEGTDEREADEFVAHVVGMYEEWLTFLLAMHHRRPGVPIGDVLQVLSRGSPEDLAWLGAGYVRTARIDCERPDLARSPETKQVIAEFFDQLASTASARTGAGHVT